MRTFGTDFRALRLIAVLVLALGVGTASAQTTVLRFERSNAQRWMLVEATINGRKGTFLLDTGATGTLVSPELAKGLEKNRSTREIVGLTTKRTVAEVGVNLTLGNEHYMILAKVYPMDDVSSNAGRRIDGILGINVLNSYARIEVDNEEQTITLVKRSKITTEGSGPRPADGACQAPRGAAKVFLPERKPSVERGPEEGRAPEAGAPGPRRVDHRPAEGGAEAGRARRGVGD